MNHFIIHKVMKNTLSGTVQSAAPKLKGFDTAGVVSAGEAKEFAQAGYAFCLRYLSLGNVQKPGDLSYNEANAILDAGLALGAVQHVLNAGWIPTKELGTRYGTNAANNAKSIGLPQGMNLWLDLEGVKTGTQAPQTIAYCNAWYDAVLQAGFVPGIYVGAGCGLTGNQLYFKLKFQHYWKSMSRVPDIPNRGYQMVQGFVKNKVFGVGIDSDVTKTDLKGGTVLWLKR